VPFYFINIQWGRKWSYYTLGPENKTFSLREVFRLIVFMNWRFYMLFKSQVDVLNHVTNSEPSWPNWYPPCSWPRPQLISTLLMATPPYTRTHSVYQVVRETQLFICPSETKLIHSHSHRPHTDSHTMKDAFVWPLFTRVHTKGFNSWISFGGVTLKQSQTGEWLVLIFPLFAGDF